MERTPPVNCHMLNFSLYVFVDWFTAHLPGFNACLISEVGRMNLANLSVPPRFVIVPDHLETDGIHLTSAAGSLFLGSLGSFLRSESESDVTLVDDQIVIDDSSDDEDVAAAPDNYVDKLEAILKIVQSNSKRLSSIKPLKATLDSLSARTSDFESQVRLRRQRDNLVFKRIKEESDGELNKSWEDRVLISGLDRLAALQPHTWRRRSTTSRLSLF